MDTCSCFGYVNFIHFELKIYLGFFFFVRLDFVWFLDTDVFGDDRFFEIFFFGVMKQYFYLLKNIDYCIKLSFLITRYNKSNDDNAKYIFQYNQINNFIIFFNCSTFKTKVPRQILYQCGP